MLAHPRRARAGHDAGLAARAPWRLAMRDGEIAPV
jgi:hypothetical protein